jgi:hypothetical protein
MRELRMTDDQLALALTDLGTRIAWPSVPDMRARVLARTSAPRRSAWWRVFWSPRYAFAPALVTIALALVAVLVFSPQARAAATDILRLRGIELFRGPVPSPSVSPSRSPGAIQTPTPLPSGLGVLVSLDDAKVRAGYPVLVPADPALGAPDQVYLRSTTRSTAVSLVYTERAGIPTSAQAGVAALVTEFSGGTVDEQFFGKLIDPRTTTVEPVTVNGQPGFWIQGTPHGFFYRVGGTAGSVEQETLRLAGNTLIWTQGDLLMRLEAQVDKATALRIAASVR